MQPGASLSPEALLGQADFVRALARSMLVDPAAADDLAQDALAAALEHPHSGAGRARAWLASVVRNLLRQRTRGEANRAARERVSARAERTPSTLEVLERESARAAVVRAVLALDEPYRAAVLLRFYEGLAPREIAARLGVPVETVRTRTKRALAALRARLDRDFGPRSSWAALLAPLTVPAPALRGRERPASKAPERTAMLASKLALVGLPVVVLATGWLELRSPARGSTAAPASRPAQPAADPAEPARARVLSSEAPPAAREPANAPLAAHDPASSALRVTVTWSDGTPAADVQLRVTDVGRPQSAALEARTDREGVATFGGLRAGKASVRVDRKHRSDSVALVAGEQTELALGIPRGFDVEGRVLGADGTPVEGALVWASRSMLPGFHVATSAADGSFSLRSLQPRVSVWARRDGHAPSLARSFRHPEGAVVQEAFELRGPGATVTGRVLGADGQPVAGASVLVDGQQMLREEQPSIPTGMTGISYAVDSVSGAHSGPVEVRTDSEGRFRAGGVRPGRVPIGASAPGHAPWRGSLVAEAGASASIEITLPRGWSLSGRVLDPEGNPAPATLMVHRAAVPALLCPTIEVGPDGSFELADLPPGELSVWIEGAHGVARKTFEAAPGDALGWEARLGPDAGDGAEIDGWDE